MRASHYYSYQFITHIFPSSCPWNIGLLLVTSTIGLFHILFPLLEQFTPITPVSSFLSSQVTTKSLRPELKYYFLSKQHILTFQFRSDSPIKWSSNLKNFFSYNRYSFTCIYVYVSPTSNHKAQY